MESSITTHDLEHLPRVQAVLKSLTRFMQGTKLYAENNPRLRQFRSDLRAVLEAYFSTESELILGVDEFAITWRGETVYTNDKRDDSLAFLLYKDGVGELTFHEGCTDGEIETFVTLLAQEHHDPQGDSDVATRLWEADFDTITYRVLDDYLSLTYEDMIAESDGQNEPGTVADQEELLPSLADKGRVILTQSDPLESIDGYLKKMVLSSCDAADETEREAHFQSMIGAYFTIAAEELKGYHDELMSERGADGLAEFVEMAIVFTRLHDNPSAVRDVTGVLEKLIDHAVVECKPRTMGRLLTCLREFGAGPGLAENIVALCAKLENRLSDADTIARLSEQLIDGDNDDDVLRYFRALGQKAVQPLLLALHRADGAKLHRKMCKTLVAVAGDDLESVVDRLDIDTPEVAYDAIYLLREAGINHLNPTIQQLLFYPEARVKEEMIRVVSEIDTEEATELLIRAMKDPDKRTRVKAMEAAARTRHPRVVELLTETAFDKNLSTKPVEEQEQVFKSLGLAGDRTTVERLRRFAFKRGFMGLGRNVDNKLLAIRALEYLEDDGAREILMELCSDASDAVSARATRALRIREQVLAASAAAASEVETS